MAAKLQSQRDDLGLGCFFPIPFIYTLHTPKYLDLGGLCFFDREFTCRTIHRSNVRSSVAHRVVQSSRLIQEHFHHPSRCPLCCTVSLPGTVVITALPAAWPGSGGSSPRSLKIEAQGGSVTCPQPQDSRPGLTPERHTLPCSPCLLIHWQLTWDKSSPTVSGRGWRGLSSCCPDPTLESCVSFPRSHHLPRWLFIEYWVGYRQAWIGGFGVAEGQ